MKKILLSILCILPFLGVWCQSSEPWFYDGKQWARLSAPLFPDYENTLTSVIQGSIEIDGKTYWKVFNTWKEDLSDLKFSDYYLREAGNKIYRYHPSTKEEKLFLDFDLKKGDIFTTEEGLNIKIIEVTDTVLPNGDGIRRKCIKAGSNSGKISEIWVEGVGSLSLGIEGLGIEFTGGITAFLCCHDENKSLYMNEHYNTCFRQIQPPKLMALDKQWAVWSGPTADQPDEITQTYVIKDRKGINDNYYYEVWHSLHKDLSDMKFSHYMREENDKIYVYNKRHEKEYLWFDFNLNVGDKFSFYTGEPNKDVTATVVAITDTIFTNGDNTKQKCFHLEPSYCGIMVEGIGSLSDGISESSISATGSAGKELLCHHNEYGLLIYQSESGTCYKSTGIETNPSEGTSVEVQCFEKGKLSFRWDITLALQQLSIYTENGTLYKKETIPSNECQFTVHNLPQGTFIYVFTSANNNEKYKGKIYVK